MSKYLKISLVILVIAILIGSGYFIYYNFSADKDEGEILGEVTTESEYEITVEEETEFYNLVGRGIPQVKLDEIKNNLNQFKKLYKEGYFVIVKVGLLDQDSFRQFY
ncbi:hypothetical protein ACFL24_02660, partial [Patescibacteria group bacterium]